MKNLIIALFFLFTIAGYGQLVQSFYIEIPNKKYVPVVTHHLEGNRIKYAKTENLKLDKLINSYKIYSCKKISKQNIYLIECNNIQMMYDLYTQFKDLYPRLENANGTTLTLPNDYGSTGGYTGPWSSQEELDFIRAPEAWGISTGSRNIIIGVADGNFYPNHEDLVNKMSIAVNPSYNYLAGTQQGTYVASIAAADTNNNKGMSAIGYDSYIYAGVGSNTVTLDNLSKLNGVKVINGSWYSHTTLDGKPDAWWNNIEAAKIDSIINHKKIVVVMAAGNGGGGNSDNYYFPASYKDVISVSSICHVTGTGTVPWQNHFETVKNSHSFIRYTQGQLIKERTHQHNDSVDIVAPGINILVPDPPSVYNSYGKAEGTSYAAPIVSGTVALMFDVNYCLHPKEVETILKLTAVKIDTLTPNLKYYGKLGAGLLDAYEAVKMAKDMADPYGIVDVKNCILYRPWFYKLETAPFEIKMTNNKVSGGSKLKFKARNNINILSGDYSPNSGYIDLNIDSSLALNCQPPPSNPNKKANAKILNIDENSIDNDDLSVFPNPNKGIFSINLGFDAKSEIKVAIYDILGKEVYKSSTKEAKFEINVPTLTSGLYFIKLQGENYEETVKFIKE